MASVHTDDLTLWVDIASVLLVEPPLQPADVAEAGEQVALFFGPCVHCGQGYVTRLPDHCPVCDEPLRRLVDPVWELLPGGLWLVRSSSRIGRRLEQAMPPRIWALVTFVWAVVQRQAERDRRALMARFGRQRSRG